MSTFTCSISPVACKLAKKWSKQQTTDKKSQQVLLNTLSVSFMNFYLECMGFETDLEASDSWNPVEQTLMDIADLLIKNLGKLECRPVLENSQFVYVPPEVQSNRIGYVVVQISESLQSAKLLGFIKEVSSDNLPINSLQPIENLLKHLEGLEVQKAQSQLQGFVNLKSLEVQKAQSQLQDFVNLKRWLENIFESDWFPIESILFSEPALQFRSAEEKLKNKVSRAKLIDFGIQANRASVGIVVKVSHDLDNSDEMDVLVELHPTTGQEYLPPSLHIMILDEEGTALLEAKAKNDNKKIELEFSASVGDTFSVKIALGDIRVIENFVL